MEIESIIVGMVTAVVAKTIENVTGKFLKKFFPDDEKTINIAQNNCINFFLRVREINEKNKNSFTLNQDKLESIVLEPNFKTFFEKTILLASQTKFEDKHKLLGRLLLERMQNDTDDYFSLVAPQIVDILSSFNKKHLNTLAIAILLDGYRPGIKRGIDLKHPDTSYAGTYWRERLINFRDNMSTFNRFDMMYIIAQRCLYSDPVFGGRSVDSVLKSGFGNWDYKDFSNTEEYKILKMLNDVLDCTTKTTTLGYTIGVMMHDIVFGTHTDMNTIYQN